MPRVNIYIPAMKLKQIDLYCTEHKVARSILLVNSALSAINAKGKIICSFCRRPAIGKYEIIAYDPIEGETKQIKNLCQEDYLQAEKEGVEIKEI